jgi:hypothetical protein
MAAQLLPPDWDEKPLDIYKTYYANHRLTFALLTFYPLIDMLGSGLKGAAHFRSLGAGYPGYLHCHGSALRGDLMRKDRTGNEDVMRPHRALQPTHSTMLRAGSSDGAVFLHVQRS